MGLTPAISPNGHLLLADTAEEPAWADAALEARLREAFAFSAGVGLLALAGTAAAALTPPLRWMRELACAYLTRLCHTPDLDPARWPEVPPPDALALLELAAAAPPMRGLEYLNADVLKALWAGLDRAAQSAMQAHAGSPQSFLASIHPDWRLVGRVTFHLAENKRNTELPFAFLATYTEKLSSQSKPQYMPLSRALKYAGAGRRDALLSLLTPVQRAAAESALVKELVDSGRIYQPLGWSPREAFRFLQEIPRCEQAGILVRVPDWWKGGRPSRPVVAVQVGEKRRAGVGLDAMLDFSVRATLDGDDLTAAEWKVIRESTAGLVPLRGQWVEVDQEKLEQALEHFRRAGQLAGDGVSFADAMRMLAGGNVGAAGGVAELEASARPWVGVTAGAWLEETLAGLRDPAKLDAAIPLGDLRATLRPYQKTGVQWLWFMTRLGLGACLADDMGLGKTPQFIALLLALKRDASVACAKRPSPSLLIAPASLLANWKAEVARFAPSLQAVLLHPSEVPAAEVARLLDDPAALDAVDLVVTTYGMVTRQAKLAERTWRVVALDEAQAIKNPGARQSRAVKALSAVQRVALTGTPVENRLSDLWSLFDFLNPGLLGSASAFGQFAKQLASGADYGPLRSLVRPYILRRLKTDRNVIADLPDKTEVRAYCALAPAQAALYQRAVAELAQDLKEVEDDRKRRGLVLTYLMRFKQICNHPSHWLGDGVYAEDASGKFARLRELVEALAERQERALVFTQFREMTGPLADYLGRLYGRPGLVLHGGTPVGQRRQLVDAFQREDGPPFFVLSLKAGGVGLNLTAASQVIHFDRWWNPAVENQATDRAFRIGQKRNVLVHKFICRGTLEERIEEMLESKREMADSLLGGGAEKALTDMNNEELVRFVSLDLERAGTT